MAGDGNKRVNRRFCSKETRSLTSWGDGHQRVSIRFCNKEARSLTSWEQKMVTKVSASELGEKRPDHLLSDGKRWPPKGQQQVCSKETRSLTAWWQEMVTKGSAAGFVVKRPDHLQTDRRRWPPKCQQQVLQQRDQITYFLWAWPPKGQCRVYSTETRLLTIWGQQMATKRSAENL